MQHGDSQAVAAVLIDGQPVAGVATSERGLQYGDGLFETVAVVDGRPCLWHAHMRRLASGALRLRLPPPPAALLAADAARLCRRGRDAVLKLYWTAGDSARGYRRPQPPRPRRIVQCLPWDRGGAGRGWTLRLCEHRCSANPRLAGIKHLNRLDQVLARAEWSDPAIADGLMLGQDGCLVGGTMSNLFVQRDGALLTPALDKAGIAGVVRRLVLHHAAELGSPVRVGALRPDALDGADALYLCNSLVGVARVAAIGHARYEPARPEHPAITAARADCHRPLPAWPA